jgi:hypothetical protein
VALTDFPIPTELPPLELPLAPMTMLFDAALVEVPMAIALVDDAPAETPMTTQPLLPASVAF